MASFGSGGNEQYDYGRPSNRGSQGRGYSSDGGYSGPNEPTQDELDHRFQVANRRMEESSANSLRKLHETLDMGQDTAEELERQAETLDRAERRLDEMHVDLDRSKQHLRNIKSPFGGVGNYFARRKKTSEITDPKLPKGARTTNKRNISSKGPDTVPPPSTSHLRGTGNAVVDRNLDEMGRALHQLKGMGTLIGEQLDDSEVQLDRITFKVDRTDVKIKGVNRDIRRQL